METLGDKIYNLRKEKGISQEELAFALEVSRQTISRWETDSAKPTERNIKGLCSLFDVDKSYFSEVEAAATNGKTVDRANNVAFKIVAAVTISLFLICCIAACIVASYFAFLPRYANGLNNATAYRFRYIGIACIAVGALALSVLVCLSVMLIQGLKGKK